MTDFDDPFPSVPPMGLLRGIVRVDDVGFTGTKRGMTDAQRHCIYHLLHEIRPRVARHGDCIGGDAQFHQLVRETEYGTKIVGYPPIDPKNRAFCEFDEIMPEGEYHERDKWIVDACQLLFAAPRLHKEELRSGTWTTVRYARSRYKDTKIIWPDGSITEETY